MSRYIDAEAIPALFNEKFKETQKLIEAGETQLDNLAEGFTEAEKIILFKAPTADVQEVKHAKDLQSERAFSGWTFECSRCHFFDDDTYCIVSQIDSIKYCPNCGAKMDLEDNE